MITRELFYFIKNNWHKTTLPQLMAATGLTRYKVIQVCNDNGFTPQAAVRTANYKDLYEPTPKKTKKYVWDDKGGKSSPDVKVPIVRPPAQYDNVRSLYKELQ
jgi:hypothetical protein